MEDKPCGHVLVGAMPVLQLIQKVDIREADHNRARAEARPKGPRYKGISPVPPTHTCGGFI